MFFFKKRGKSKIKKGIINFSFHIFFKMFPFGVLFGIIALTFFGMRQSLYADPGLTVQSIEVAPVGVLSFEEKKAVEAKVRGKNIFRVNLTRIADQLEREPGILNVRVRKRIPDVVKIDVERRRPFAYVQTLKGGSFAVVSQDGVIMDIVSDKSDSLVFIDAWESGVSRVKEGSKLEISSYRKCVDFLYAYWDHPFAKQEGIEKIRLSRYGNMSLVLKEGPEIRFGEIEIKKIDRLHELMPILKGSERNKIDYIDLQYDEIVIKKKEGV